MPYNSLRPIRERKGMTVAQLAGRTSISIRTLQAYEAGERSISPDDLRKLSRVLYASPTEILQPSAPPPPPLPRPVQSPPERPPTPTPAPLETPIRHLPDNRPESESRRLPLGRPSFSRPAAPHQPRPPREGAAPRPPGPSTPGQLEQIRNLARRMGLDHQVLVERIGASLESLDHVTARAAIAKLRQEMEESGTWQPRVAEGPDQEGEYLAKLRDQRIPIEVQLINGERFRGTIEDYTPYVVKVRDSDSGSEVFVRKLAIAYYRTQGPANDAQ
jgi:transcriptional regulator with XRE-family HTH domain/sRNA-binding regulator protein Hfq